MKLSWIAIALGLVWTAPVSADEIVCLSYQGRAEISGTLVSETFPGPPEYESIEQGDAPETSLLVKLAQPVCVDADPADQTGLNSAVPQVDEVQLILTDEQFARYRALVGKPVKVSGNLFGRISESHHTPVLLDHVTFSE